MFYWDKKMYLDYAEAERRREGRVGKEDAIFNYVGSLDQTCTKHLYLLASSKRTIGIMPQFSTIFGNVDL
jgi:hypothetical protein